MNATWRPTRPVSLCDLTASCDCLFTFFELLRSPNKHTVRPLVQTHNHLCFIHSGRTWSFSTQFKTTRCTPTTVVHSRIHTHLYIAITHTHTHTLFLTSSGCLLNKLIYLKIMPNLLFILFSLIAWVWLLNPADLLIVKFVIYSYTHTSPSKWHYFYRHTNQ